MCVCPSETGWSADSRCIAEDLPKGAHTGKRWSEHTVGTDLVTAVLEGLKQQLQGDGLLSVNAFGRGVTGHDLQMWEYNNVEKFSDELTGAPLDPEQVSLAKIKEVEFLHTLPAYEKVDESEAKGKELVSTKWILAMKGDAKRPDIRARFVGQEVKWK